ncbi:MAG TPA: hypothetical protein P5136_06415 [Methanofastidiosum sp.]|nr:hypothetical protein [Methanofastidiosum sp.]
MKKSLNDLAGIDLNKLDVDEEFKRMSQAYYEEERYQLLYREIWGSLTKNHKKLRDKLLKKVSKLQSQQYRERLKRDREYAYNYRNDNVVNIFGRNINRKFASEEEKPLVEALIALRKKKQLMKKENIKK